MFSSELKENHWYMFIYQHMDILKLANINTHVLQHIDVRTPRKIISTLTNFKMNKKEWLSWFTIQLGVKCFSFPITYLFFIVLINLSYIYSSLSIYLLFHTVRYSLFCPVKLLWFLMKNKFIFFWNKNVILNFIY